MNLRMALAALLFWLISTAAAGGAGWLYGRSQAKAAAVQVCLQTEVDGLHQVINRIDALGKAAQSANLTLSNTIATRQKADQQATREFAHALSTTAHLRVECVFDADVMHPLNHAADRADAAAAGGVSRTLPAGTAAGQ